jgi:hypothetical protein
MFATNFRDNVTLKPEDLNQIDLYNLVLVCKDWRNQYQKYLLDFKRWLRARTCVLNIFIRIAQENANGYILEDVILGTEDVTENNFLAHKFSGDDVSDVCLNQTDFQKEIASHTAKLLISRKHKEIIFKAKSSLSKEICPGDLIIINCYKKGMIIHSELYDCDITDFRKNFFNPCIYPPYFWHKKGLDILAGFYREEELTIVPSEHLTYSMKFKISDDANRWTGYSTKERKERPNLYEMVCKILNYRYLIRKLGKAKRRKDQRWLAHNSS